MNTDDLKDDVLELCQRIAEAHFEDELDEYNLSSESFFYESFEDNKDNKDAHNELTFKEIVEFIGSIATLIGTIKTLRGLMKAKKNEADEVVAEKWRLQLLAEGVEEERAEAIVTSFQSDLKKIAKK